jgi:steroid 5-alpha reductase family enzyme
VLGGGAIGWEGMDRGVKKPDRNALVALPVVVAIGAGVAAAGSQGGTSVGKIPVFALCVALAFLIQWLAFLPAFLLQTERFYDITGSVTFITVATVAVVLGPAADARSLLLLAMVVVWAARLGGYLVWRIRKTGTDVRFDAIKPSFVRFLNAWTLQGLWVTLTLAAALAAITTSVRKELGPVAFAGLVVWAAGFAFEVVADVQKSRFRADPANRGTFIRDGLWAWSRHPNYFGEIVLWIGVALVAVPVLSGWQWVTLISPVFVFLLITRVSGVPLLEKKADERWGGQDDYEDYKAHTPVLIPLPRTAVARKEVRQRSAGPGGTA